MHYLQLEINIIMIIGMSLLIMAIMTTVVVIIGIIILFSHVIYLLTKD